MAPKQRLSYIVSECRLKVVGDGSCAPHLFCNRHASHAQDEAYTSMDRVVSHVLRLYKKYWDNLPTQRERLQPRLLYWHTVVSDLFKDA